MTIMENRNDNNNVNHKEIAMIILIVRRTTMRITSKVLVTIIKS